MAVFELRGPLSSNDCAKPSTWRSQSNKNDNITYLAAFLAQSHNPVVLVLSTRFHSSRFKFTDGRHDTTPAKQSKISILPSCSFTICMASLTSLHFVISTFNSKISEPGKSSRSLWIAGLECMKFCVRLGSKLRQHVQKNLGRRDIGKMQFLLLSIVRILRFVESGAADDLSYPSAAD